MVMNIKRRIYGKVKMFKLMKSNHLQQRKKNGLIFKKWLSKIIKVNSNA